MWRLTTSVVPVSSFNVALKDVTSSSKICMPLSETLNRLPITDTQWRAEGEGKRATVPGFKGRRRSKT